MDLFDKYRQGDKAADADAILSIFVDYVDTLGISLYPAQEEAILELLQHRHVILNTPTGSGKSMVALALHFQALAENRVSWYTAPTKALVNEKFFWLCEALGPTRVGLLTGDGAVNPDAPVICCTAEILSNRALREDNLEVDYVIMDEFHYYGDRDRGIAWQIPLITMRDSVFLLMSATLGNTDAVAGRLAGFSERRVSVVKGGDRPVPLSFHYRETHLHETVESLVETGESPVYLVSFTQRDCAEQAQNLMSINVCTREEKRRIAEELNDVAFDTPYGREFQRFVRHGIGVHHAGLLPRYRRVVERLAQAGLIKVISGTDTLGVGVNIPIRTVVLRQLYKFDGEKVGIITAREFHQIAGRAGRKGFDDHGNVVLQAPEWVIENQKLEAKALKFPHLKKKMVKKKPPPRSLPWDETTFERLQNSDPEALSPRFEVTHGMLVNLLQGAEFQTGGGYGRLVDLIARSHGTDEEKKERRRHSARLFRDLRRAGIISLVPNPDGFGAKVQVGDHLQRDFSLNQALSLYLVETLPLIEETDNRSLVMLSLVEAILEDPRVILYRQVDKQKGELVGRLKAEGMEYEERMSELEKVEHPKPEREFIYETFNAFAMTHPWVGQENIRPKSVAREMFEGCYDFNTYVTFLGISRAEGVLLRYLSQVYKTAVQNVPRDCRDAGFEDILAYLHGIVRRVDSSLLDEWTFMVDGTRPVKEVPDTPVLPVSIADDPRAFRARVRDEMHTLLGALARRDWTVAAASVRPGEDAWTEADFEKAMEPYYDEYAFLDVTPAARMAHNTVFTEEERRRWRVQQRMVDPEGHGEWGIECSVDLSRAAAVDESLPLIEIHRISG